MELKHRNAILTFLLYMAESDNKDSSSAESSAEQIQKVFALKLPTATAGNQTLDAIYPPIGIKVCFVNGLKGPSIYLFIFSPQYVDQHLIIF